MAPRSRRDFMANIILGTGTVLGLGSLAYRFLEYLYPLVPPIKLVEVPVGKPDDIPSDGVRLVQLPEGPIMLEKADNEVQPCPPFARTWVALSNGVRKKGNLSARVIRGSMISMAMSCPVRRRARWKNSQLRCVTARFSSS